MTTYAGNEVFQPVAERGWRRGLSNLWRGEFSQWFRSSRWLKQLLLWLLLVNLMMLFMAFASQEQGGEGPDFLFMYGIFGGMFVAFGVMVIMQRAIVGEKREGTAAWVLSKPVTRSAFVISRLLGNALGILVTSTLIPGILVYITAGLMTPLGWLPPLGFLAGLLIFVLHVLFWLTLTLMMGTFFESTGGVIAVPIALYFALWFVPSIVPNLLYADPLVLTFSEPEVMQPIGAALMSGTPVETWLPVIVTGILCVVFTGVSIWRFNRQEF
jgi:ABC-2 type transport system permease protein